MGAEKRYLFWVDGELRKSDHPRFAAPVKLSFSRTLGESEHFRAPRIFESCGYLRYFNTGDGPDCATWEAAVEYELWIGEEQSRKVRVVRFAALPIDEVMECLDSMIRGDLCAGAVLKGGEVGARRDDRQQRYEASLLKQHPTAEIEALTLFGSRALDFSKEALVSFILQLLEGRSTAIGDFAGTSKGG